MEWYLAVLKNYAGFGGRARRKEYWMFFLFNIIFSVVLSIVDNVLGTGFLAGVYALVTLLPGLAVAFRRMHDTGRSAWWLLIGLVPLVGAIILIVFLAGEGEQGDNKYGPNPKLSDAVA